MATMTPHLATDADAEQALELIQRHAEAAAQVDRLTRRLLRVERTIEAVLASPALTKAQRAELVGLLAGTRSGATPGTPVSSTHAAAEHRLIAHYRAMAETDKRIVSQLCARLAAMRKDGA